jgi:crotonobetainyl-CoA:carnitine CoA-transferase CaiB-like acyl-CoA transferase
MNSEQPDPKPAPDLLTGVRVLELAHYWAAGVAGALLADAGAEVIRVEAIQHPDPIRLTHALPLPRAWEQSPLFNNANRNKRDLTLDLGRPVGLSLVADLVRLSDIVIENFSVRVLAGFGLEYPALRAVRPDLIMLSLPGFGRDGPWRNHLQVGPILEALSGISQISGYNGGPPMMFLALTDPVTGVHASAAALAALVARREDGRGRYIEMSQYEVSTVVNAEALFERQLSGLEPLRAGSSYGPAAPRGCYRCAGPDDWLAVSVTSEASWHALCAIIGRPGLANAPHLASAGDRRRHQAELDPILSAWAAGAPAAERAATLLEAGIAAAPVRSPGEVLADAELNARGFFPELDHAVTGPRPYLSSPYLIDGERQPIRRPGPLLGEDNDYVLRELLGLPDAAIHALAEARIIGHTPVGADPEGV